jgi:hypothetical protein
LGIRNLLVFNRAMLDKWMWRYEIERDAWWRIVVDSKYGSLWGGWCSLEPAGTFEVRLWKNIRKGWESFSSFSRLVVQDGTRIRFWHDLWCGNTVLKDAFLVLFGIARSNDASVAANVELLGSSIQWNVSFTREAHDWEVGVFASFLQVLHLVTVRKGSKDELLWVPSKRGIFKVKSFLCSLCYEESRFPWKSVWRTQAPLRAAFFAWLAALGKILTLDNLRKQCYCHR